LKHIKSEEFYHCYALVPETPMEAIQILEDFFEADMWYAKGTEWKTEADMINYLKRHFEICKDSIKKMGEVNETNKHQEKEKEKESKKSINTQL